MIASASRLGRTLLLAAVALASLGAIPDRGADAQDASGRASADCTRPRRDEVLEVLGERLVDAVCRGKGAPAQMLPALIGEFESLDARRRPAAAECALRLSIAQAVLSSDENASGQLARRMIAFAPDGRDPVTGTPAGIATPLGATSTLWNALIAHARFAAAAHVARVLVEKYPGLRYPRRLLLLALTFDGKLGEAGDELGKLLESDPVRFGFEYRYRFVAETDPRIAFWASPSALSDVPICQELRGTPAEFTVGFDLPEIELWVRAAAADGAFPGALEAKGTDSQGWRYLIARALLERALATGKTDAAATALEDVRAALGAEGAETWLAKWLEVRVLIARADLDAVVARLGPLATMLWPNLRNPEQLPAGVVARAGPAEATAAFRRLLVDVSAITPPERFDELSGTLGRYFFGRADAVAAKLLKRLTYTDTARLDAIAPGMQKVLLGGPFRHVIMSYLRTPADETPARIQLDALCAWKAGHYGSTLAAVPPDKLARDIVATYRIQQQHGSVILGKLVDGWRLYRPMIVDAAAALTRLSGDGGKAILEEYRKDVEQGYLNGRRRLEDWRADQNQYLQVLTGISTAWERYDALAAAVSPETLAAVGAPQLGALQRAVRLDDLRAILNAGIATPDARLTAFGKLAAVIPAEGILLPVEMLACACALEIGDGLDATQEEERARLRFALENSKVSGPFLLYQMEDDLSIAAGGQDALRLGALRRLFRHELRGIARQTLHLANPPQNRTPEQSLYFTFDGYAHWGYPARFAEVLGEDDELVGLYRRSVLSQIPLTLELISVRPDWLSLYSWMNHTLACNKPHIEGMLAWSAALGVAHPSPPDGAPVLQRRGQGRGDLPAVAESLYRRAWACHDKGDLEGARRWLALAARLQPGVEEHEIVAAFFEKEGDKKGR